MQKINMAIPAQPELELRISKIIKTFYREKFQLTDNFVYIITESFQLFIVQQIFREAIVKDDVLQFDNLNFAMLSFYLFLISGRLYIKTSPKSKHSASLEADPDIESKQYNKTVNNKI